MAKLPAFGRELLELRRFGNRKPKFDAVFVTDWWDIAKINREKLGYCTLVIEPFERYSLSACTDLDVILVMRGNKRLALEALRRSGARSVKVCTPDEYLDWVEWIVVSRAKKAALNG
jgi:hypothetical protein